MYDPQVIDNVLVSKPRTNSAQSFGLDCPVARFIERVPEIVASRSDSTTWAVPDDGFHVWKLAFPSNPGMPYIVLAGIAAASRAFLPFGFSLRW